MADQDKQLDHLLNSLLNSYADAEPRPGFETRLRAALREPRKSFSFGWIWMGAAALAAFAAAFAVYYLQLPALPPAPGIAVAAPPVLPAKKSVVVPGTGQQKHKPQVEPLELASDTGIRQPVFPTPQPLSEQEKLMLLYLAGTPRNEVAAHAREDKPVEETDPVRPESQRSNGIDVFITR